MDKKVLIVSYYYFPDNNPRAFRTTELVNEFGRRGYYVDVIVPIVGRTRSAFNDRISIYPIEQGFFLNKYKSNILNQKITRPTNSANEGSKYKIKFFKILKKIFRTIYLGGKPFEYAFSIIRFYSRLENKKYDAVISIGLPFSVHLGVAVLKYFKPKIANLYIADYGDPFTYNVTAGHINCLVKPIEQRVLNQFNYVVLPTLQSKKAFVGFEGVLEKIRIIPQGLNFEQIKLAKYLPNETIRFAYAGNFYEDIRNPVMFFRYLNELRINLAFKFIIYTDISNQANMKILSCLVTPELSSYIEIKDLIPRMDCIFQMSKCDFLISFSNSIEEQTPSKLIDYALSGRPYIRIGNDQKTFEKFQDYLEGKYDKCDLILDEYNIINTCNRFEELIFYNFKKE